MLLPDSLEGDWTSYLERSRSIGQVCISVAALKLDPFESYFKKVGGTPLHAQLARRAGWKFGVKLPVQPAAQQGGKIKISARNGYFFSPDLVKRLKI